MSKDNTVIPCSGFIILSKDLERVVIVSTHSNNLGFPKGKRNKFESYTETSFRELEEETGLTKNDVEVVENLFFDELSKNGNPATRYFIAYIKDSDSEFFFDGSELFEVSLYQCKDLFKLDNFKDSRKIILKEVLSVLK